MTDEMEEWKPVTRLGKLVAEQKISTIDDVIRSGLPLREPQIIDFLMPELEEELLDVNMVQRMTDSGRRVKFRVVVCVGNRDGYVGVGQGKGNPLSLAIEKASSNAKLAIIKIRRGCGAWDCDCGLPHSIPFRVEGKSGGVRVFLIPAPTGPGLVAAKTPKVVFELAGIKDVWTRTKGMTKNTMNLAKATYNALRNATMMRV